jgi:hypothetical protein
MIRGNLVFRRIARALAAVQLLLSAAAPFLETASFVPTGQASIMAPGTGSPGARLAHDPSTCPACQLLRLSAWKPEPTRLVLSDVGAHSSADFVVRAAPTQAPRQGFNSRAPPSLLA